MSFLASNGRASPAWFCGVFSLLLESSAEAWATLDSTGLSATDVELEGAPSGISPGPGNVLLLFTRLEDEGGRWRELAWVAGGWAREDCGLGPGLGALLGGLNVPTTGGDDAEGDSTFDVRVLFLDKSQRKGR